MDADSSRWNEITPCPHPLEYVALKHVRDLLPNRHPYQTWSKAKPRELEGLLTRRGPGTGASARVARP